MKRIILTISLILYGIACCVGQERPDSLSMGKMYYSMADKAVSEDRYEDAIRLGKEAYAYFLDEEDCKGASDAMALVADAYELRADIDSVMACLDTAESVLPPQMEEARLDILCRKKYWARKYDIQSIVLDMRERIRSLSESSDNPSVILASYFDMAEDASAAGQLDRAEALYLKAVELADKIQDKELEYDIYGQLYLMSNPAGRREKALEYALKALRLSKGLDVPPGLDCYLVAHCLYNAGHPEQARAYADSLLEISATDVMTEGRLAQYSGTLELLHGAPERALSYLSRADSCLAVTMPQENPERVQILAQMGKALRLAGKLEESAEMYAKYSDCRCRLYGRESRYGFKGLRLYAEAEMLAGHYSEAEMLYSDVAGAMISRIKARMPYLTSDERPGYLSDMQDVAASVTEFASVSGNRFSPMAVTAYNAHLMTKGLLLASERSVAEKVFRYDAPEVKSAYYKVIALHGLLADREAASADTAQIAETYRQLHSADVKLSRLTGTSAFSSITAVDFSTVSNALKDNEILADMIDYVGVVDNVRHYQVFVLGKGWTAPEIVDICTETALDSLADAAGGDVSRLCEGHLASVTGRLLHEIMSYVSAGETLYVVPSGRFNALPFESFDCGGTMLSEEINVLRLSSAREIVAGEKRMPKRPSAAIFGGMYSDIDAAGREVKDVCRALGRKSSVKVFSGAEGTAANFLALDGRAPEVIHVASHGFYYDASDETKPAVLVGRTSPMELSGLVMYGDELLSSDEISGMNLDNAALVCLSACYSGRGKTSVEGIYGLQRAFKKAGAGTIVMSLWEASDVASALFMSEFYRLLTVSGGDSVKAFNEARACVKARYPEPFYWAGYVMLR